MDADGSHPDRPAREMVGFPLFCFVHYPKICMTQMGLVLGLLFVSGMVGKVLASALSDHFGRRSLVIISLLISAGTSLAMGLTTNSGVQCLLM